MNDAEDTWWEWEGGGTFAHLAPEDFEAFRETVSRPLLPTPRPKLSVVRKEGEGDEEFYALAWAKVGRRFEGVSS